LRTMPSSALSGGMARRALLGAVLACNARALFLDEPTAGLDPEAIGVLIETLTTLPSLNKLGLLIATHDLEFAAQLCDEFILLSCGTVAAHGELKGTPDARAEHLLAAFEASDPCFGSRRPS
ncbi:MAG: AAA family ATPase, partial [Alphaproteobacteria bacterium]